MNLPRFFHAPLAPGEIALTPEEAHHATHALRLRAGAPVILFDGAGRQAKGTLSRIDKRQAWVEIEDVSEVHPRSLAELTLAFATPKTARQGYLVEKLTELGVACLWPMVTARTVITPSRQTMKKWERRALEACKQSGSLWTPRLRPPARYVDILEAIPTFDAAAVAHPDDRTAAVARPDDRTWSYIDWRRTRPHTRSFCVLIGPEGGLTEEEVEAARSAGAAKIQLGPHRLRVETAAVAVAAFHHGFQPDPPALQVVL